jgi:dCTP deaminase
MVLTRDEILARIDAGIIKIDPFERSSVGPASIDLSLGDKIRVVDDGNRTIEIDGEIDFDHLTREVDISEGFVLPQNALVLGITLERITLPDNICGWLQSRSRYARIGLMSHITAPFVCPGVSNRQVLEIFQTGPYRVVLRPGLQICQLILQTCEGHARYEGIFKDQ